MYDSLHHFTDGLRVMHECAGFHLSGGLAVSLQPSQPACMFALHIASVACVVHVDADQGLTARWRQQALLARARAAEVAIEATLDHLEVLLRAELYTPFHSLTNIHDLLDEATQENILAGTGPHSLLDVVHLMQRRPVHPKMVTELARGTIDTTSTDESDDAVVDHRLHWASSVIESLQDELKQARDKVILVW